MKACTYFITAIILLLVSFGASSPLAASATLAISVILIAGGLYTSFVLHYN